jgi:lysine-arginine-ornithine-binding protein
MQRLLSASAILLGLGAAAAPASALTYCVEGAYPPFSQVAPDGSITGFDIDIGMALCKQMGEECTLVKVDWDGIIPALLEKKCDAIMASMSATEDRKQVIDFSDKYYQVPNRFAGKADAGLVDTPEGMAGKTVGVQRGTIHQAYMEAHYPDTKLALYGTQDEADLDLAAGRVDALMADMISLDDGFLKTPAGQGFAFFGAPNHFDPAIHGTGASIGVRKEDTALRDKLSAAIQAIRADGTYDAIAKKYFDQDIYGD